MSSTEGFLEPACSVDEGEYNDMKMTARFTLQQEESDETPSEFRFQFQFQFRFQFFQFPFQFSFQFSNELSDKLVPTFKLTKLQCDVTICL